MGSRRPLITIVAAMAENRVIGRANGLPWHLPADLAYFKKLTLDKPIIMGRRTWESLPGLLPRRVHIVVSRVPGYRAEGCLVVDSPEAALAAVDALEVMVVGGAQLYRAMLPRAARMHLTLVATTVEGDTYFPAWKRSCWREISRKEHPRDGHNRYDLTFLTLERIRPG